MSINGNQPHLDLQGQNALSMPDIQIELAPKTGQYQVKEGKLVRTDPITGQEKVYNVKVGGIAAQGSQLETIAKLFNEEALPDLSLEKGQTFTAKLKYDPSSPEASKVTYYTKNQDGKLVGQKTRIDQKSENFTQIATSLKTLTSKVDTVGTNSLSGKEKPPPPVVVKETQHGHRGPMLDLGAPDTPKHPPIQKKTVADSEPPKEAKTPPEAPPERDDTPELWEGVEPANTPANQAADTPKFNQSTIDLLFSDDEELEAESADSDEQLQEISDTPERKQGVEASDGSATQAISTTTPQPKKLIFDLLSTIDNEESEEPTEVLYDTNTPELSEGDETAKTTESAKPAHSSESVVVAKSDSNKNFFGVGKELITKFNRLITDASTTKNALVKHQEKTNTENFTQEITALQAIEKTSTKVLSTLSQIINSDTIDVSELVNLLKSDDVKALVESSKTFSLLFENFTTKLFTPDASGTNLKDAIKKSDGIDLELTSVGAQKAIAQLQLLLSDMKKNTPENSPERTLLINAEKLATSYTTSIQTALDDNFRLNSTVQLETLNTLLSAVKNPNKRIALKDGQLEIKSKGILTNTQTIKEGGAKKILQILYNAKKNGFSIEQQLKSLEEMPEFQKLSSENQTIKALLSNLKDEEPGMAGA